MAKEKDEIVYFKVGEKVSSSLNLPKNIEASSVNIDPSGLSLLVRKDNVQSIDGYGFAYIQRISLRSNVLETGDRFKRNTKGLLFYPSKSCDIQIPSHS